MEGRFCSLDQTLSDYEWNLVEIMIQVVLLFPKYRVKTKQKVFTAIWLYIRLELVGFIRAYRHFFVWSYSAEILMGVR